MPNQVGFRKKTVFVALAIIAIAGVLGGFLFSMPVSPPSHQSLVNDLKITDTTRNFELTCELVGSGSRVWGQVSPLASTFVVGNKYECSTWIWSRFGDPEIAMSVWGKSENGYMYIELGRLGASSFTVTYKGVTKLNMPAISTPTAEGYYILEIPVGS